MGIVPRLEQRVLIEFYVTRKAQKHMIESLDVHGNKCVIVCKSMVF